MGRTHEYLPHASVSRPVETRHEGREILKKVNMKPAFVCDVTPCSVIDKYHCFGGTCYLRFQGRKNVVQVIVIAFRRKILHPYYW
jgi:hypothetical protein